ncbi:MAG: TetR family transcriptional regulator [Nitrospirales bacterium]|nr:TetR family transcriptional regulator [Nitrospirales bacterium]
MARSLLDRDDVIPQLAEVFREHGFEGTTLTIISKKTGLGKGSLYHFFPGGKEEMAEAVLTHIDQWFQNQIFDPLTNAESPIDGLTEMLNNVATYFESGQRVCIVGMFALGETRDRFRVQIQAFFDDWRNVLVKTLRRAGLSKRCADDLAIEILVAIQGGLVLTRAADNRAVFNRTLVKLNASIKSAVQ